MNVNGFTYRKMLFLIRHSRRRLCVYRGSFRRAEQHGGLRAVQEGSSLFQDVRWIFSPENTTFCQLSKWRHFTNGLLQPEASKAEAHRRLHPGQGQREDAGVAEDGQVWQEAVRSLRHVVGHRPCVAVAQSWAAGQDRCRGERVASSAGSDAEEYRSQREGAESETTRKVSAAMSKDTASIIGQSHYAFSFIRNCLFHFTFWMFVCPFPKRDNVFPKSTM